MYICLGNLAVALFIFEFILYRNNLTCLYMFNLTEGIMKHRAYM